MPKFIAKPLYKIEAAITPSFVKDINDKLMPDSVRKQIIKSGGSVTLANKDSETVQAANEQTNLLKKQAIDRSFAERYNGKAKWL